MKVTLVFNDGTQVRLTPETPREKKLLQLAFEEKPPLTYSISDAFEIAMELKIETSHERFEVEK